MVKIATLSAQGGRDYNEDSVGVWEGSMCRCVVVADGLGGHGGGKVASSIAVGEIKEAVSKADRIDEPWILELYRHVNRRVLQEQTVSCKMKTTCVSLFLEQGMACWAHLGDSRLYHFEDGVLKSRTLDHSVSQMAVFADKITEDQIRFHEDRNRVLRAFGAESDVHPDIKKIKLVDNVLHSFLLCTDGFWEYVLETEMEIDLLKTDSPEEWLRYMEERLKRKAGNKNDNYSAGAVFLYGSDWE